MIYSSTNRNSKLSMLRGLELLYQLPSQTLECVIHAWSPPAGAGGARDIGEACGRAVGAKGGRRGDPGAAVRQAASGACGAAEAQAEGSAVIVKRMFAGSATAGGLY